MVQTISWSYTGDPGPMVKIELLKGGVVDSIIAAGTPIGSSGYSSYGSGGYGSYDWFIPVEQAAGSDYAIRVTSTSNSLIAGTSKNSFTIVPTSITLTSPNGGNSWAAGTLQTISWSYKGDPGSMVRIELLKGGVVNTTIAADTPIGSSGSGSYSWLIPVEQAAALITPSASRAPATVPILT